MYKAIYNFFCSSLLSLHVQSGCGLGTVLLLVLLLPVPNTHTNKRMQQKNKRFSKQWNTEVKLTSNQWIRIRILHIFIECLWRTSRTTSTTTATAMTTTTTTTIFSLSLTQKHSCSHLNIQKRTHTFTLAPPSLLHICTYIYVYEIQLRYLVHT